MTDNGPLAAFVEIAYRETLVLLKDTRDLLERVGARDGRPDSTGREAIGRSETIRALADVSRRLTEAMSWLMLRRAVSIGEIDSGEASRHPAWRLGPLDDSGSALDHEDLPVGVRGVLDRGARLCMRVRRLEAGARREGS